MYICVFLLKAFNLKQFQERYIWTHFGKLTYLYPSRCFRINNAFYVHIFMSIFFLFRFKIAYNKPSNYICKLELMPNHEKYRTLEKSGADSGFLKLRCSLLFEISRVKDHTHKKKENKKRNLNYCVKCYDKSKS